MGMLTFEQLHKNMSTIKSVDTSIEIKLRKALWHKGIRYRKNMKIYSCRPDIVITKHRIAIFCDGDFWHGNKGNGNNIKNHTSYWMEKIKRNVERDLENTIELRDHGWVVLRFWEKEINKDLSRILAIVLLEIEKQTRIKRGEKQ